MKKTTQQTQEIYRDKNKTSAENWAWETDFHLFSFFSKNMFYSSFKSYVETSVLALPLQYNNFTRLYRDETWMII